MGIMPTILSLLFSSSSHTLVDYDITLPPLRMLTKIFTTIHHQPKVPGYILVAHGDSKHV